MVYSNELWNTHQCNQTTNGHSTIADTALLLQSCKRIEARIIGNTLDVPQAKFCLKSYSNHILIDFLIRIQIVITQSISAAEKKI